MIFSLQPRKAAKRVCQLHKLLTIPRVVQAMHMCRTCTTHVQLLAQVKFVQLLHMCSLFHLCTISDVHAHVRICTAHVQSFRTNEILNLPVSVETKKKYWNIFIFQSFF